MYLKIRFERSSVCMGDDVEAPHAINFEIKDHVTVYDLAHLVIKNDYLPKIEGGKATWLMVYKDLKLSVIAQQWKNPKMLIDKDKKVVDLCGSDSISFHFLYKGQVSPSKLKNSLKETCIERQTRMEIR